MIGCYLPAGRYRLSRFPGEFALHRSGQRESEVKRKGGGEARKPGGVPFLPAGLGVHRGGVPS